jgi:hypothetical protein
VRDGEPLLHDRGLESGRILSGHKQTTDSEENIPLVRTDRSGIDHTKTTISSQMEMNTVPVIPGYQEVTVRLHTFSAVALLRRPQSYYKSWLKRIVCANSGRSPQKVESAIIVQTFSLPSPPADPHSPNKPPSKKRKLSSDEVESGCRIAQAAMAMHKAGSVNPEPMNAGVSPMTASDGEETMTGPTPLGTKAYKSLTQVPDASGNTLSKVQGSLMYEMLQEHGSLGILDIFEKAQRYPQEKARVDRLQAGKIAATQEANEAQAQLCAEKSKVEHLRAEKAELEHIVWEKEDQVKASNQNVLDLRASLEDALDKANDADRKFRESRQENDDKTKLLEEKNKELHNYDHLKAQMLDLMTEFTLGVKLLAQSHSNLRNSVQRLHSDADWDRWRKWPLDKYGEMHEIENVRRQQALSAEGDATERLEGVDRVCRKILSVIAGVEPSGAAK